MRSKNLSAHQMRKRFKLPHLNPIKDRHLTLWWHGPIPAYHHTWYVCEGPACFRTQLLMQTTQLPACPPLTCLDLTPHLLYTSSPVLDVVWPFTSQLNCVTLLSDLSLAAPPGVLAAVCSILVWLFINRTLSQPTLKSLDLCDSHFNFSHSVIHIHISSLYAVWYEN